MAQISGRPTISMTITLELTEEEARALDAIVGYGEESFLKTFYEHMGKSYLQKHESGLRSLFNSVQIHLSGWLSRANSAREIFEKR